jgi:hypothetical protein
MATQKPIMIEYLNSTILFSELFMPMHTSAKLFACTIQIPTKKETMSKNKIHQSLP